MRFRNPIAVVALLIAMSVAPVAARAQDGVGGAFSRGLRAGRSQPQIATADFDQDQKPDGAILVEGGPLNGLRTFHIELHVSGSDNGEIVFSSRESGLAISARDVNEDGAPDIVVERAFSGQKVQVYLNDGHGTFHAARAEDYPSPDPSAPSWRTRAMQDLPAICLPVSRGFETECLQQISILSRDASGRRKIRLEGFLVQSAARAPAPSRGPPSLLS